MMIDYIQRLDTDKKLFEMVKSGLVNWRVILYRDIYYAHDIELRKGADKMVAVQYCMDKFNVGQATVYRALEFCKS